jgi:hypothetical protein
MALARKREWYFEASLPWTIVWCLLTLGTFPMLLQSFRFDRFRRLEWNQYRAYAQWLHGVASDPIAADLEKFAEKAAGRPSPRFAVKLCVLGALAIAAVAFFRTNDLVVLAQTVFYPQSLLWPAIAYSAILSVGWFVHLMKVVRQQTMTTLWVGRLNELLTPREKRPVPIAIARVGWPWLLAASVIAIFGPTWAAVALVAIVMQNRYTSRTRLVRLAMLERMLEWMDTSGLPVEFDIEEIEPEELVAMG